MSSRGSKDETDQLILQTVKEQKPETVEQLIALVGQRLSIPDQQILKRVRYLQEKEKIHLRLPQKSIAQSFTAYLKTAQASWYWITIGVTVLTGTTVLTVPDDSPLTIVRVPLGMIYVLWLPGYVLTKSLFPVHLPLKVKDRNLDIVERIALSLVLSIALVPIVGLLLNYTPWGIRLIPVTLSLAVLTSVLATVAITREYQATKARPP